MKHLRAPQPPVLPIVGNLHTLDTDQPVQSLMRLAGEYGPFYKMQILDRSFYVAGSQALVNELCDETRFRKSIHAVLGEIRDFAGDGLFTAQNDEPNWARAHRLLMPAFGPLAVRDMLPRMVDIADQMFVRWERFGADHVIDVSDNMTRLTLDTIALCAFDYRFNSFYHEQMHPFVGAMVGSLDEAERRSQRPRAITNLMVGRNRRYAADQALLHRVAHDLIAERRRDPKGAEKKDLLNLMLNGVDPVTGEGLSDENIAFQMVTFLIAGHETTSGLLSFATYLLLKNPDVLARARAQVDAVLGDAVPQIEHLTQLRYIEQILMETLRIWPTAPAFAVRPVEPTVLGGIYPLTPEDEILILQPVLHRDPAVWGADAERFRPERFAPEEAEKLPPNAWKPFGNGARACIGRPFAMQEAQLVLIMMLQRFDFALDDPDYQLRIHETLTLKPENLRILATPRLRAENLVHNTAPAAPVAAPRRAPGPVEPGATAPALLVLYGSNTGSAEAFANRLADEAGTKGFRATVAPMDDHAGDLPRAGALIVVTASYEGQPPDNARRFVSAVEGLQPGTLDGLRFAVFGCGNRQWARTYQAVPKRVEAALATAGATPVQARGEADSGGDFFGAFDSWCADFWPALTEAFGMETQADTPDDRVQVEFVPLQREKLLRLGDMDQGTVIENRELVDLTKADARSKRHVEIALPAGMTYRTGDYLAVLPQNPDAQVERALRRLALSADTQVVLSKANPGHQPVDLPIGCGTLLRSYVELGQPATRAQVAALSRMTRCPPEKTALEQLASDGYEARVLDRRVTVLDLLEEFQSCQIDLGTFLGMLPPMRARQYSISSAPLWNPDRVTLTVAVVDAPALSGRGQYQGVASCHLARLQPGDRVSVAVRPSNARFHPPADPATPIIMICAGSGIAPFRGFLQERAAQRAAGQQTGPALLFFGTTGPDTDFLYHEELAGWEKDGVATILPAFSARPDGDIQFVQHRVWAERARIEALFRQGATIYVCGDGRYMAPAVREALIRIYRESSGATEEQARVWADRMEHERGRYVSDVFA